MSQVHFNQIDDKFSQTSLLPVTNIYQYPLPPPPPPPLLQATPVGLSHGLFAPVWYLDHWPSCSSGQPPPLTTHSLTHSLTWVTTGVRRLISPYTSAPEWPLTDQAPVKQSEDT